MPSNSAKRSQVLHNTREPRIDCSSSGRVAPQGTTHRTSTILVQTHSSPQEGSGSSAEQCLSVCRTSRLCCSDIGGARRVRIVFARRPTPLHIFFQGWQLYHRGVNLLRAPC